MLPLFKIDEGAMSDVFTQESDRFKAEPLVLMRFGRKRTIGETGVTLNQFYCFGILPPETRNTVYKHVLKHTCVIQIVSVSNSSCNLVTSKPNCTAILRANKAMYAEARNFFYSENTFAIGNGTYASASEANIDGLCLFLCRSPSDCIPLIKKVHINMYADRFTKLSWQGAHCGHFRHDDPKRGRELQTICMLLCKYFRGVRKVLIKHCVLGGWSCPRIYQIFVGGCYDDAATALRLVLNGTEAEDVRASNSVDALPVRRLHWFQEGPCRPDWMTSRFPHDVPGTTVDTTAFADMVEGEKEHLKEEVSLGEGIRYWPHEVTDEGFERLDDDGKCSCQDIPIIPDYAPARNVRDLYSPFS